MISIILYDRARMGVVHVAIKSKMKRSTAVMPGAIFFLSQVLCILLAWSEVLLPLRLCVCLWSDRESCVKLDMILEMKRCSKWGKAELGWLSNLNTFLASDSVSGAKTGIILSSDINMFKS